MKDLDPFSILFSGVNLIEASAGTGKTYNIASLYVRGIIEEGISVDQILVVTYTKAATKELRERLLRRLRLSVRALRGESFKDAFLRQLPERVANPPDAIQKLQRAIHTFDEAAVFTIHGFCQHILQNRAFESGALFSAELVEDDRNIISEMIDDYWRRWVDEASKDKDLKPLLDYLVEEGIGPEELSRELSPHIEKPYLQLRPSLEHSLDDFKRQVGKLRPVYKSLKSQWEGERDHIISLLLSEQMSGRYYRKDWLSGWMQQMDNWLQRDVLPVTPGGEIERFRQSVINESTKKNSKPAPEHPFFQAADAFAEIAQPFRKFDLFFKLRLYNWLQSRIEVKKERLQVFSYDDLLIKLQEALCDDRYGERLRQVLRETYPVAMVDEFQDTDPIQYQIFRSIYGANQPNHDAVLFMIGDPKQSIYSFRGADIFTYLKAKKDTDPENIFGLKRNFRSVPALIKAVNVLFSNAENPFVIQNIPFNRVQAGREDYDYFKIDNEPDTPIKIRDLTVHGQDQPLNKTTAEKRAARDTAHQIRQLLQQARQGKATIGDEPLEAGHIAVIVRSHSQAEMISEALRDINIKSVRYSRDSVFKSEQAKQLQHVLQAIAEPGNEGLVKAALSTTLMGYKAGHLLRFEQQEQPWIDILERFAGWNEKWQQQGIVAMFGAMMNEEQIAENLIARAHGERKLTNVIHLIELLQQQEQSGTIGMRSLLRWLAGKINEDRKSSEEEQLRLESDENLIKIVTMHRSKGLEYPVVFCPFLWKGPRWSDEGKPLEFHDGSTAYLDLGGKDDPDRRRKRWQALTEAFAESLRLAYVAMTRAKYQCNLAWVQAKKTEFSPLGYLMLGKETVFSILREMLSDSGKYKPLDTSEFKEAWERFIDRNPTLFALERAGSLQTARWDDADRQLPELENRTFSRAGDLDAGRAIGSFSSLVRNQHEPFDGDYIDYFEDAGIPAEESPKGESDAFIHFPRGPESGTAIHHIFENIAFDNIEHWDEVIAGHLAKQSIEPRWGRAVAAMLRTTVQKSLLPEQPALQLKKLEPGAYIPEMEFYFRSSAADLPELLSMVRPHSQPDESVHGFAGRGFLKGFIDLTFQFDRRFYIVDYKSNYLGASIEDYGQENMQDEMRSSFYDLQYHIYSVALHQFLSGQLSGYCYEKHFGGAFYLFLRGLNPEGREGIYFDRPPQSRIEKLHSYLKRGRDEQ